MKPVTLFAVIVAGVIVGTLAVREIDALRIAAQQETEQQELRAAQDKFIDALTSAGFLQRVECEGQQVAYVYGGSAFSSYPDDPQRDERLSLIWHLLPRAQFRSDRDAHHLKRRRRRRWLQAS